MSNTIWAVDGSFFAQRLSGIQRYSIELLAALDRIVPPGFVEIVTPPGVETPHYTNIKVVSFARTGAASGSSSTTRATSGSAGPGDLPPAMSSRCSASAALPLCTMSATAHARTFTPTPAGG